MNRFVLDTSVTMAWCFEDETSRYSERVLEILSAGEALVPSIWPLEVVNVLTYAERRRRLTRAGTIRFLTVLGRFPITIDGEGALRAFEAILPIARERRVTAYDAAYLELAMRESLPLATLDVNLKRAAQAVGIGILAQSKGA
ncbi:MAG: type II toxin-antitoxin system VapC family toxin [Acidobacteria bacterium]|nr:type II toxin-antitoxin system VapC family toxin [Acidobacteriota bacterium]